MNRLLVALLALGFVAEAGAYERSITPQAGAEMEWNTRKITYAINEEGSDDMDFATLESEVALSFAPWAAEACAVLDFVYEGPTAVGADPDEDIGYDDVNVVVFREEQDVWNFDADVIAVTTVSFCEGTGGVCDFAGEILDADIEVNGFNFRFSTTGETRAVRFDLRNTLTHEVGHLLGFDHTPVADATMFASAPPRETSKRDLAGDDIDGLCDVYESIWSEENPAQEEGCSAMPAGSDDRWPLGLALLLIVGIRSRRGR